MKESPSWVAISPPKYKTTLKLTSLYFTKHFTLSFIYLITISICRVLKLPLLVIHDMWLHTIWL